MSLSEEQSERNESPARTPGDHPVHAPEAWGILGGFELRKVLGRGGMGTVYEAWQQSLQRRVALKVLGSQVAASPSSVQRFVREAQAAARLQHTHITQIYAQGEQDGVYYYAMEYVDGPSLHAVIERARRRTSRGSDLDETVALPAADAAVRKGPATVPPATRPRPDLNDSTVLLLRGEFNVQSEEHFVEVARHMATVADGLAYAHEQGVIHRDVKPHNLLFGTDGRLRITDFGLARMREQPGVTMTGELLGSPLYMSPEQISGASGGVDHRTDIYSLGATMYEWLTLVPPYPGDTREQVIGRILHGETSAPRFHNAAVPLDLETICLKALERDRERRYRSATDLRDDLHRFLEHRPIKARRASLVARGRKLLARHQVASVLTGTALVAAVLSGALLFQRGEVRSRQAEAEQATAAAAEAQQEFDQLLDVLSAILPAEIGQPLSAAGAALPMVQGLVQSRQRAADSASLSRRGGANPSAASTPEGLARRLARELFNDRTSAAALAAADTTDDEFNPLLKHALALWGTAEEHDALPLVASFLEKRPDRLEALALHSALLAQLGRYGEMVQDAERMVRVDPKRSVHHVWLGLSSVLAARFGESLMAIERAKALGEMEGWCDVVRALVLIQVGKLSDAVTLLDGAVGHSPTLVVALLARATARAAMRDMSLAIDDVSRVLELEPENADVLAARGLYFGLNQEFGRAADDLQAAMRIAGPSTDMSLLWAAARSQQRQSESAAQQDKQNANGEPEQPLDAAALRASQLRAQEWFSRHVWPRMPTPGELGTTSPSVEPDPLYGRDTRP